jgi:hypothetical protein
MTESSQDFNARLSAFLASAAAGPTPLDLEDRIVGYVRRRRRRFAFLLGSSPPIVAVKSDHAFSAPSRRAAWVGTVTAALATVAVAVVGLASHHVVMAPGAGGRAPVQQMTATTSPVDVSDARAAAAAFFDPSLPQCWKDAAVKGTAPPIDMYARCPLTSRLASRLRAEYGGGAGLITAFRTPAPPPAGSAPAPSPLSGSGAVPHYTITIGTATATSTGVEVKVRAVERDTLNGQPHGQASIYENDAILIHNSAGWLIDDILIHGRNVPYPSGHAPDPGAVPPWQYFMPDASGFPVSVYNVCTTPTATAPARHGC